MGGVDCRHSGSRTVPAQGPAKVGSESLAVPNLIFLARNQGAIAPPGRAPLPDKRLLAIAERGAPAGRARLQPLPVEIRGGRDGAIKCLNRGFGAPSRGRALPCVALDNKGSRVPIAAPRANCRDDLDPARIKAAWHFLSAYFAEAHLETGTSPCSGCAPLAPTEQVVFTS